jgi:hypothetical protein
MTKSRRELNAELRKDPVILAVTVALGWAGGISAGFGFHWLAFGMPSYQTGWCMILGSTGMIAYLVWRDTR